MAQFAKGRTPLTRTGLAAFPPFWPHASPARARCLIGGDNPLTVWVIGMSALNTFAARQH